MPPIALFRIVILSGNRHLNSLDPLAAIYEPMKIPRTKKTPQSINLVSPVTKKCTKFADGVVIPKPSFLPVDALIGQAKSAISPIAIAAINGMDGIFFQKGNI